MKTSLLIACFLSLFSSVISAAIWNADYERTFSDRQVNKNATKAALLSFCSEVLSSESFSDDAAQLVEDTLQSATQDQQYQFQKQLFKTITSLNMDEEYYKKQCHKF